MVSGSGDGEVRICACWFDKLRSLANERFRELYHHIDASASAIPCTHTPEHHHLCDPFSPP